MQHHNGNGFEEVDEEERPPTEYDEDGVLTTSLHSFADLRIIKDMASSMPASGVIARFHVCAAAVQRSVRVCGAEVTSPCPM